MYDDDEAESLRERYERYVESNRRDARNGIDLDHYWRFRPPGLTIPEWCAAWRKADRRPALDRPIVLYRGGMRDSMSWTDSIAVALLFANQVVDTTAIYWEFLGDVRLPIWRCEFPPGAVLGYVEFESEYVIDIERFPPVGAAEYEPTPDDLAAYRDLYAPILPEA